MYENEKTRILNMFKDGTISVEEAEKLLNALGQKDIPQEETVSLKDNRGRKSKKLRIIVDAVGHKEPAKVNINIPISLIKSLGPIIAKNLPKEAKEELNKNGIDIIGIMADIENLIDSGMEEDIINIDAGEGSDKAKVRIYVE